MGSSKTKETIREGDYKISLKRKAQSIYHVKHLGKGRNPARKGWVGTHVGMCMNKEEILVIYMYGNAVIKPITSYGNILKKIFNKKNRKKP